MPKSLFGGPPPQAPAAPGSPGLAAGPQIPQAPMQAQPNIDPELQKFMEQNPHLDPMIAQQAFQARKSRAPGLFPPQQQAPVDPYQNFANKATGKPYR